jgi:uncharacterized GH25 family protein
MRSLPIAIVALLSWALILPTAVSAADLWIQPKPVKVSTGVAVAVSLYEGSAFEGTERSYREDRIALFQRLWKGGRANLRAADGAVPAGTFTADRAGVQLIAFESASGDRFCKSLVVVGQPQEGDPLRWSELGQTLEIVPQTDPVALASDGGMLEVQVLFEREPLADATVSFVPESDARAAKTLRTDEIGVVRFRLDRAGLWLIRTSHGDLGATLTLTAGAKRDRAGS